MSDLFRQLLHFLSRLFGLKSTPTVVPDPTPDPIPAPSPAPLPTPPAPSLESKVAAAINAARASADLAPLVDDPSLDKMAGTWATSMASDDRLGHGNFAGRITAIYPNTAGGEDIAEGQPDAASVVAAWMDSPPHRANILGDFDRVGIGSARDEAGAVYWCADFVRAG